MLPSIAAAGAVLLTVGLGLLMPAAPPGPATPPNPQGPPPTSETTNIQDGSQLPGTHDEVIRGAGPADFPLRDPVRGISKAPDRLSLVEVESIHIPTFGSDASLRALRKELMDRLGRGRRFRITARSEEADAMLRLAEQEETLLSEGASDQERREPTRPLFVLVNRGGEILWRESPHPPSEDGVEARALRVVESLIAGARQSP